MCVYIADRTEVMCDVHKHRTKIAQEQCRFTLLYHHVRQRRGETSLLFVFYVLLLETSISLPKKEINIQYLCYLSTRHTNF